MTQLRRRDPFRSIGRTCSLGDLPCFPGLDTLLAVRRKDHLTYHDA